MLNKKPLGHNLLRLSRLRELGEGGMLKRAKFEGLKSLKKPKMQKRETQAELDKRFENLVRTNLGARGLNDKGELSWPMSYEKIRQTAFNREWRDKVIADAKHTQELNRKVDSVRNVSQKMHDANKKNFNKPKMLRKKRKKFC